MKGPTPAGKRGPLLARAAGLAGQGLKYGIVGVIGTFLHFAVLVALVELFGVHPVPASVAGFVLTLVVSFLLNRSWTFAVRDAGSGAFVKYAVVSVTGLLLNTGIMYTAVEWLHWKYWIGQLIVVLVVPPCNFILNALWTFGKR